MTSPIPLRAHAGTQTTIIPVILTYKPRQPMAGLFSRRQLFAVAGLLSLLAFCERTTIAEEAKLESSASQRAVASEISFCKFELPDYIKQLHATFNLIYSFEVDEGGHAVRAHKIADDYVGQETVSACIGQWRFRGIAKDAKMLMAQRWEHGIGWVELSVTGNDFSQVVKIKDDAAKIGSGLVTDPGNAPVSDVLVGTAIVEARQPIEYENRNQVDPKPLTVLGVSGRVISEVGDMETPHETGVVPGARLGLFTEQEHTLVATYVADDEGHFQLTSIPSGKYRLVVSARGLCVANLLLRVIKGSPSADQDQIVVHMRPAGIDSCSYGEYARRPKESGRATPVQLPSLQERPEPVKGTFSCPRSSNDRLRPVRLSSSEIMQRVIYEHPIERPGILGKNRLSGEVTIEIMIDKHGSVSCGRGVAGNPIGIAAAISSIRKWTFRPYVADGKGREILGILNIPFDFGASASLDRSNQP